MTEHAVVIAGGGPTGLMLAGELALEGVDVVIVERRPSQELDGSRAGGLHSRTIEVLDQRGIAERFVSEGQVHPSLSYAYIALDISDFPTRHNYLLALWQSDFERILAGWVHELGVPILRACEVVGFAQDDRGVDVEVSGDVALRAEYLVGCDGGRSLVRKVAGIDFPGLDPSTSWMIAEVEMAEEPEIGVRREGGGIGPVNRVEGGGPFGVVLKEKRLDHTSEPPGGPQRGARRRLRDGLRGAQPEPDLSFHRHEPAGRLLPRGPCAARRGRRTRASPAGRPGPQHRRAGCREPGMEARPGGQEDVTESLLDTYHAERHPVGARVLRNTMAQVALSSPDDRHQALRDTMAELLSMDEPRRRLAAEMSGLGIHYDLGAGHALLGRRMPDLDLVTADGPLRVFTLLHDARPLLLNFGEPGGVDITPWADRIRSIDVKYAGMWELPAIGAVPAPTAVVIRPDGYVAWVGDRTQRGLADALTTWFGPPAAA